jgi:replicative DNA helicase
MASVIVDRWRRRSLIAAAGEMQRRALEGLPDLNGANIASDLAADFARLADDNMRDNFASLADGFAAVIEEARRAAERGGNPNSLTTGFQSLDDLLNGGFEPGQLIVLAGRTRMGKTVIAQEFTLAAAHAAKGVAFYSLDTSLEDLQRRFVVRLSGIPLRALRRGDLHQSQWDTLVETQQTFGKLPITISDEPTPTVAQIRLRTRRIARRHPVGMIVVDHLDYIARPKGLEREGKVTATGANTAALKALAKEFGVPVVLLVQVSRSIEHRSEKRPVLADLSWSGSIEQDADTVIFVHREEAYGNGGSSDRRPGETDTEFQRRQVKAGAAVEASKGKGELIVAKQRQGASGIVHIRFDGAGFRATDAGPGDVP